MESRVFTIMMAIALAVVYSTDEVYFYGHTADKYRKVPNPTLPDDYLDNSSSIRRDCATIHQCSLACQTDQCCEASVYDAANRLCVLYSSVLINITSANQSNDLTYSENIHALTSLKKRRVHSNFSDVLPTDCQWFYEQGMTTGGVYVLRPARDICFTAWCEFDDDHGWTVIQRRFSGEVYFYRSWSSYKEGFGRKNAEYWLGNDNLHALTQTNQKLSIFMTTWDDSERKSASYTTFRVDDESDYYRLTISGYSGTAGDAMTGDFGSNNQYFSTYDADHDSNPENCAYKHEGGWWYNSCYNANLNGLYCGIYYTRSGCSVWGVSGQGINTTLRRIVMLVTRD